jgi:hypothetical protein
VLLGLIPTEVWINKWHNKEVSLKV